MKPGDLVDDFTAVDDEGRTVTLSELVADGPVVLFFYPKAHTAGCTMEACHFRDLEAEFAELGARRVGVSRDDVATQREFREANALDYPLLADEDGSIGELFGARRIGPLWHRRVTAIIDEDRRLLDVIASETDMQAHADEALALLRGRHASPAS